MSDRRRMIQTEGTKNADRERAVRAAVGAAQGGACKHSNVVVLTITDRRTSPPTQTHTITCDDCKATL